jgi:hypothetical protein
MKKLMMVTAVALAALATAGQKASAWTQIKFGAGINFSLIGGGNSILWGAYCSQLPPPDLGCGLGYGFDPGAYGAYGGHGDFGAPGGYPVSTTSPVSTQDSGAKLETVGYPPPGYGGSGYQPVGYGYYQAPSYWYGR